MKTKKINNQTKTIPDNWEVKKLKDLFKIKNGELIKENQMSKEGTYPVFSSTRDYKVVGYINEPRTMLRKELDLVIPSRGGSIGEPKLMKEDAASTQTTLIAISLTEDKTLSEYIFNYLDANKKHIFRIKQQTAILQLTRKELEAVEIPVPSIEEMKEINLKITSQKEYLNLKRKEIENEMKKLKYLEQNLLTGAI